MIDPLKPYLSKPNESPCIDIVVVSKDIPSKPLESSMLLALDDMNMIQSLEGVAPSALSQ